MTLARPACGAAALLGLLPLANAQSDGIDAYSYRTGPRTTIRAEVDGQPNLLFGLFTTQPEVTTFSLTQASMIQRGRFDPFGHASLDVVIQDINVLPAHHAVRLWLVTRGAMGFDTESMVLPLRGNGGTLCQDFDPDYKLGPVEPVPGELVSDQWSDINIMISADNNTLLHPDEAVFFDSSDPTGGDTDLMTPGPGPGNDTALGQLIVIAENVIDADMDGLVDDPDDEQYGGTITFDFAEPFRMCSATLVDIDDAGQSELRFYLGDAMTMESIPLQNLGDNSVQTVTFDKRDVRRFEVVLAGSGGLAHLGMIPCPITVNLDESPFGAPLPVAPGQWIDDEFQFLGVTVDTNNANPAHPDKAILFDSEDPTGDDFDLMTPGYGVGNDTPLGKVLIIAENDVDADMDGLVDNPDDEEMGGQMSFSFVEDVTFLNAAVLDVDGNERDVFTFFDASDNLITVLEIDALGDNSVQTLESMMPIMGVRRMVVNIGGSGALAQLRWCPSSNVAVPNP